MTRIQLAIRSPYISLLFTPKWRLHLPSELPQVSYYSIVHPHWNVLSSALSSVLLLTPRISYPGNVAATPSTRVTLTSLVTCPLHPNWLHLCILSTPYTVPRRLPYDLMILFDLCSRITLYYLISKLYIV